MDPRYYIFKKDLARIFNVSRSSIFVQSQQAGVTGHTRGKSVAYTHSEVRKMMESKNNFQYPKQVISVQMLKGGSTKTTTVFNLGVRLHELGARVLLIDSDGQGNLTSSLRPRGAKEEKILYHLIRDRAPIQGNTIHLEEGFDFLPSNFDNATIDNYLMLEKINFVKAVSDLIKPIRDEYDFIIFDCTPALSLINLSIAVASDQIIIPTNPDAYSEAGLKKTIEELERFCKEFDIPPIPYKILFSLYDAREITSTQYLLSYHNHYSGKLFSTAIRRCSDAKNAVTKNRPIFEIDKSPLKPDFDMLCCEVLGLPLPSVGEDPHA